MNFSKMLASSAIVLVASLAIISEASGPYRAYLPTAPAPQHRAPHGPYHSYAVRPAIYGGPRLYSYRGYARHPLPARTPAYRRPRPAAPPAHALAPVHVHLKAAAYSPYSHAPIVAPLHLAIETAAPVAAAGPHYGPAAASAAHYGAGSRVALRPVKTVLLAPLVAQVPVHHSAPLASAYPAAGKNLQHESAVYENQATLAGQLYSGEAPRPASYGSGHYYQALEIIKAQGGYRESAGNHYNKASSAPSGGY